MRRWREGALLMLWATAPASAITAPADRAPTAPATSAPPPAATVVTVERCADRFDDGRCVLPSDGLLVVTSSPARALTLRVGGAIPAVETAAASERTLAIAPGSDRLEIAWRGEVVHSARLLPAGTAMPGRDAFVRARVARRSADGPRAVAELRRAIDEAHAAGALSVEVSARVLLSYVLFEQFAVEEALDTMAAVPPLGGVWIEGEVLRRLQLGILRDGALDLPAAAEDLLASAREARRARQALAQSSLPRDGLQQLALLYARVGRLGEAWATLREVEALMPPDATCDERADLLGNLGFVGVVAYESGVGDRTADLASLSALLARAVDEGERCPVAPRDLAILRANLARASLLLGRIADAARDRARAQQDLDASDVELRADLLDLESGVALAAGRTRTASAAAEELARLAATRQRHDLAWRAHVRRGQVAQAQGASDTAAAAYQAAEAAASQEVAAVALAQGALSVPHLRQASAARLIALELARGRREEALRVARQAIRRGVLSTLIRARLGHTDGPALQALRNAYREAATTAEAWSANTTAGRAARARMERLTDEARALAAPPPESTPLATLDAGEVLLTWFPLDDGWVAFAADGRAVAVAHLGQPPRGDAAALAAWALAPLWPSVARARRVRLQPFRALADLDLHAARVDGRRLIDVADVVYGLDLPRPDPRPSRGATWLIGVSDPSIPDVDAEIASLRARLPDARAFVGSEATAAVARAALTEAEHLHFAGHARFTGLDGLGSYLVLDDARLPLGDILWARTVPRSAVLSACESAGTTGLAGGSALGLAQAFALMGSEWVIAPTRPVDDGLARAFAEQLYARGVPSDPAAAVRETQRALAGQGSADWAAFRVIVP